MKKLVILWTIILQTYSSLMAQTEPNLLKEYYNYDNILSSFYPKYEEKNVYYPLEKKRDKLLDSLLLCFVTDKKYEFKNSQDIAIGFTKSIYPYLQFDERKKVFYRKNDSSTNISIYADRNLIVVRTITPRSVEYDYLYIDKINGIDTLKASKVSYKENLLTRKFIYLNEKKVKKKELSELRDLFSNLKLSNFRIGEEDSLYNALHQQSEKIGISKFYGFDKYIGEDFLFRILFTKYLLNKTPYSILEGKKLIEYIAPSHPKIYHNFNSHYPSLLHYEHKSFQGDTNIAKLSKNNLELLTHYAIARFKDKQHFEAKYLGYDDLASLFWQISCYKPDLVELKWLSCLYLNLQAEKPGTGQPIKFESIEHKNSVEKYRFSVISPKNIDHCLGLLDTLITDSNSYKNISDSKLKSLIKDNFIPSLLGNLKKSGKTNDLKRILNKLPSDLLTPELKISYLISAKDYETAKSLLLKLKSYTDTQLFDYLSTLFEGKSYKEASFYLSKIKGKTTIEYYYFNGLYLENIGKLLEAEQQYTLGMKEQLNLSANNTRLSKYRHLSFSYKDCSQYALFMRLRGDIRIKQGKIDCGCKDLKPFNVLESSFYEFDESGKYNLKVEYTSFIKNCNPIFKKVPYSEKCKNCNGEGYVRYTTYTERTYANGTDSYGNIIYTTERVPSGTSSKFCSDCHGLGKIDNMKNTLVEFRGKDAKSCD